MSGQKLQQEVLCVHNSALWEVLSYSDLPNQDRQTESETGTEGLRDVMGTDNTLPTVEGSNAPGWDSASTFRPSPPTAAFLCWRCLLPACLIPSTTGPILTTASEHCCIAINIHTNNEQLLVGNYWLKHAHANLLAIPCQ